MLCPGTPAAATPALRWRPAPPRASAAVTADRATTTTGHRCCSAVGPKDNVGTLMLLPQHRGAIVVAGHRPTTASTGHRCCPRSDSARRSEAICPGARVTSARAVVVPGGCGLVCVVCDRYLSAGQVPGAAG